MAKKYVSISTLQTFLDNLKNLFATKTDLSNKADETHTHAISDVKGVAANSLLVGNSSGNMVEKTPAEVLELINGASVKTMTTAEYNALEATGATRTNTLYMLTDAEEESSTAIQFITWEADD